MDLIDHIEAFVAVAEARSFTRAAETLGVAQPLLSRRVQTLEQAWAGTLLDRSGRRMALTPLGELALPYARDVLERARHLGDVIASARASAVHVVGVPVGCPPPALARIIRGAAERGMAMAVHELPAAERADALRGGRVAVAVLRADADASLCVPLGVACEPGVADSGATVHLDALRPRRTDSRAARELLVTAEDDLEPYRDRLHRAIARAGLPEEMIQIASSSAAAAAEVLARGARLLCDSRTARRHDLQWTPLADRALYRGYEIAGGLDATTRDWLRPLLAHAIGARAASGAPPASEVVRPPGRLAAHG